MTQNSGPVTDDELLRENALWEMYRCARHLPESPLNRSVTLLFVAGLVLFIFLGAASALAKMARSLVETGFSFTLSILSFLIAGFTIYLAVTNVGMLLRLAARREPNTRLPWIKYIAFHFLRVMAVYIAFLLYCVAVMLFASPDGLISNLMSMLPGSGEQERWWVAAIALVFTGGVLVNMVMLLQSFVANIYTITMMNIVGARQACKDKGSKEKCSGRSS